MIFEGIRHGVGSSLLLAGLFLQSGLSTAAATLDISVQTADGSALPNSQVAVAYLSGNGSENMPVRHTDRPEMAQENLQFSPYVKVVRRKTEVAFPNKDDVAHHVYSFSKNNAFELPLYRDQKVPTRAFEHIGQVTLGCNIHDWMLGYVLVVDTPLYTQFDGQTAQIKDIPSGNYTLHFWHPGMDRKENIAQSIVIGDDTQAQKIQLQFQVKALPQPEAPEDQFDDASDY